MLGHQIKKPIEACWTTLSILFAKIARFATKMSKKNSYWASRPASFNSSILQCMSTPGKYIAVILWKGQVVFFFIDYYCRKYVFANHIFPKVYACQRQNICFCQPYISQNICLSGTKYMFLPTIYFRKYMLVRDKRICQIMWEQNGCDQYE